MDGPPPDAPLFPCKVCGRKFVENSLIKHEAACAKLQTKKRKVFDIGKQRAQGSDIPITSVRKVQKEISQVKGTFKPPKSNWREQHDNFVGAIRSSRDVDVAMKTGSPLPPPPRSAVPSNYVQCEYCNRNFNSKAAERHIPFCKEHASRNDQSASLTPKTTRGRRGDGNTAYGKSNRGAQPGLSNPPRSKSIGRPPRENSRVIEHNNAQSKSQTRRRFVSTSPPLQRKSTNANRNANRSEGRPAYRPEDQDYRKSDVDQLENDEYYSDEDDERQDHRGISKAVRNKNNRSNLPFRRSAAGESEEHDSSADEEKGEYQNNFDNRKAGPEYWRKQNSIDDDEHLTRRQMAGPRPRNNPPLQSKNLGSRIPQPGAGRSSYRMKNGF